MDRKALPVSAVQFSTSEFEMAHGHAPRGVGSWAFCPAAAYRRDDYLQSVRWFTGAYGAAKRAAAQAFAADGVRSVVVCS